MIKLVIDGIPPSLNRFAGRGNLWEYRHAKDDWTAMVQWAIKMSRTNETFAKAAVTIRYFFPDRRRRDPDNFCGKFLLDGLTRGGVIVDDDFRHITLTLEGAVDPKRPRVEIEVRDAT